MEKPRKIVGYRFANCMVDTEDIFLTEQEALDEVEIEEIDAWECPECSERFDNEYDAQQCCVVEEDDADE